MTEWDNSFSFIVSGRQFTAYHVTDGTPMGENFLSLPKDDTGQWHVFADTVRDRCDLAGLKVWDGAVPQAWYDENRQEIADRGGWVVWHYPEGNILGEPMFADEVDALAIANVRRDVA